MSKFDEYWEGVKTKIGIDTDSEGDEEGWGEVFEYSRSLEAECKSFSESAFEHQQDRINKVIERLGEYPCCMSCYLRVDEMKAAKQVKEKFISILKEGLL
tara:strand:- start:173 stop:472 length:300 start_codon:yes stop_codon:yes gene_type:complete